MVDVLCGNQSINLKMGGAEATGLVWSDQPFQSDGLYGKGVL